MAGQGARQLTDADCTSKQLKDVGCTTKDVGHTTIKARPRTSVSRRTCQSRQRRMVSSASCHVSALCRLPPSLIEPILEFLWPFVRCHEHGVPPGWQEHFSHEHGIPYYYNKEHQPFGT